MSNENAVVSQELPVSTDSKPVTSTIKSKVVEPSTPENVGAIIYIGDSLPGLQQYSIFSNGIPKSLEADIKKCPALQELLVPVSQLGSVRNQVYVKGTREYTLNLQVKQYKGGNK